MKILINPLLWYLIFQLLGLIIILRNASIKIRRIIIILILFTGVFALVSTPLFRSWLERSLETSSVQNTSIPSFIFVLGGGYSPGETPGEDVLVTEGLMRALHGASIWRRFPEAHLVFSGGEEPYKDRDRSRALRLMAEAAQSRGVQASNIIIEAGSRNTMEHPIEALKLPGVTPSSTIGIVTSSWHMWRAKREFCRYFSNVKIYPVISEEKTWKLKNLFPSASNLEFNTTLIKEWVGLLWYSLLSINGPEPKC